MPLPRMVRVRQTFPATPCRPTSPTGRGPRPWRARLPVKRGRYGGRRRGQPGHRQHRRGRAAPPCAGCGSSGARPFVFPAMGSHGGGTAEGQLSVLEHYGITEATMGCPVRATMEVVEVGEALGPAGVARSLRGGGRLDRAGQPDQAPHRLQGLDRVRPLQDDDDRAGQVDGRHPVPPGQRHARLRDGDHRGRAARCWPRRGSASGSASSRTATTRRRSIEAFNARRSRGGRARACSRTRGTGWRACRSRRSTC